MIQVKLWLCQNITNTTWSTFSLFIFVHLAVVFWYCTLTFKRNGIYLYLLMLGDIYVPFWPSKRYIYVPWGTEMDSCCTPISESVVHHLSLILHVIVSVSLQPDTSTTSTSFTSTGEDDDRLDCYIEMPSKINIFMKNTELYLNLTLILFSSCKCYRSFTDSHFHNIYQSHYWRWACFWAECGF